MLNWQNLFYVYGQQPHQGAIHNQLLGKFLLHDGNLQVLEDHVMPRDLERMSPQGAADHIKSLADGQRTAVVNAEDIRQGLHPELIPQAGKRNGVPRDLREAVGKQFQEPAEKTSKFHYHRIGAEAPQELELRGERGWLDGHELAVDELGQVVQNVKTGKAQLRHHSGPSLQPQLQKALDDAQVMGPTPALRDALTKDTLVPEAGNRAAYRDFLSQPSQGVHVHLNLNGVGDLNSLHGPEAGNELVASAGRAIAQTARESIGRDAKVFRVRGDKFVVHAPNLDTAAVFARSLRSRMEGIPSARGSHPYGFTMGLGLEHRAAEEALKDARATKAAAGSAHHLSHIASRIPGREGVVET